MYAPKRFNIMDVSLRHSKLNNEGMRFACRPPIRPASWIAVGFSKDASLSRILYGTNSQIDEPSFSIPIVNIVSFIRRLPYRYIKSNSNWPQSDSTYYVLRILRAFVCVRRAMPCYDEMSPPSSPSFSLTFVRRPSSFPAKNNVGTYNFLGVERKNLKSSA